MRRVLSVTITAALLALSGSAYAGQIWTDGDGDGLPDIGTLPATPSTNVTIGVWIDAQSFNWTNYLTYVEWTENCFSYISATYVITGGSNFPIDNFSHPRGIGFGGSGFNEGGVDHIGNYVLHVNLPVSCCVSPIIDIYNPYYVFSQLGAGSSYMLFTSNPNTCYGSPETEACCFDPCSGGPSCRDLVPADCVAQGGVSQGPGTSCGTNICPPAPPCRGACCFSEGSCAYTTEFECGNAGGVYQGNNTDCGAVVCPQPTGACCLLSGDCFILTADGCVAIGGIYLGDDVPCQEPCEIGDPIGACCLPDDSCLHFSETDCIAAGGIYFGDRSVCTEGLCDDPPDQPEACCFMFSECADLTPDACRAQGGVPQGPGTSCAGGGCDPPLVASCCLQDGSCVEVTQSECGAMGGSWVGGGSCGFAECTSAVESRSWGNVKGLFR